VAGYYSFNRYELKYIVDPQQVADLWAEMGGRLEADGHNGAHGGYKISSVYYDSEDLQCYWEKVDGEKNRRKVRLRTYLNEEGLPQGMSFLEIKQRINRTVQKRRTDLGMKDAQRFLQTGSPPEGIRHPRVIEEIAYLRHAFQLRPTLVVSYKRKAFYGVFDDGLRVTLDYHVKCRADALDAACGEWGHYMLPPDRVVMEVKVNDKVPLWLSLLLGRFSIVATRISKYCRGVERAIRGTASPL